jgi:phosphoglycerate kinase
MLQTPKISDIKNKTVLVRVDFNVPLKKITNKAGAFKYVVADDQRLKSALETMLFLKQHAAKIVLLSHLGRPDGKVVEEFSLRPVAHYLRQNLNLPVEFASDCCGEEVRQKVSALQKGQLLLLENLRFHPEEEKNDQSFAKQIIADCDAQVFINEAFSASHRAHASVVGLAAFLQSFAGFDLAKETTMLTRILEKAQHPFVVVLGGAKIDDKVSAVKNLSRLADLVLVGGGLANAFLKASGIEVHKSFMGKDVKANVQAAAEILAEHRTERTLVDDQKSGSKLPLPKIVLPVDVLAAPNFEVTNGKKVLELELLKNVQDSSADLDLQYLDIGPQTIALYKNLLGRAKTIFWNGPLGVFENPLFAKASQSIAKAIAINTTDNPAVTVCGGGETAAIINNQGLHDKFSHVSTAGGAALEFLGGQKLPGIEILKH